MEQQSANVCKLLDDLQYSRSHAIVACPLNKLGKREESMLPLKLVDSMG